MSIESAKILRNGKVSTDPLLKPSLNGTDSNPNLNMESSTNFSEKINQSGGNSPTNEDHNQLANEERFNRLQDEMSVLKSLLEKIITQNEERNRQHGGPFATSAYAVGTSNMVTGVNRTHRNQRNQFNVDDYDEEYEDAPSNKYHGICTAQRHPGSAPKTAENQDKTSPNSRAKFPRIQRQIQ